jgi:hypothetical protein
MVSMGGFIGIFIGKHLGWDLGPLLLLSGTIAGLLLIIGGVLSFAVAKERPPLRKAARVLGISAGLIAVFGVLASIPAGIPRDYLTWGILLAWGILCCLMATAGGALALGRLAVGGTLMLVGGMAGWGAAFTVFYLVPRVFEVAPFIVPDFGWVLPDIGYWVLVIGWAFIIASLLLFAGTALSLSARKQHPRSE